MATFISDMAHSEVSFKVKHMMITHVTGSFLDFNATLQANQSDFTDATINFEANTGSISTRNEQRDAHLQSPDFFDAQGFPKIEFVSTKFIKSNESDYILEGDLTIKGVLKPITLQVEYTGTVVDPYGQTKAGFEISGKINRKDFGLTWGAVTETGGIVVSDEIKLLMNIQMIKQ